MKHKFALIFVLFFQILTYAQNETSRKKIVAETNVAELYKMADYYAALFQKQKAEAFLVAKQKGWKTITHTKSGGMTELMRIENGLPIYYTTDNNGAGITTRTNKLHTGGSLGLNLDGQNMTIGIWDGGKVRNTHTAFSGRVTISDNAPTFSAHPTHVAGTMVGGATNPNAKGMAPLASLLAYDWNNDTSELSRAAANGLLISNHSYGYSPEDVSIAQWGRYDSDSRTFDNIMFNAPYYLFVNSAGNSRNRNFNPSKDGYDLLAGKSTSKNSIIVAAVGQVSNYTGPGSVPMSSFSSWGPTDDGRIKPDISGKGVNLLSSLASSDNTYGRMSGTSMASPNVAGTLLLLQQHYNNVKGNFMKSATLRGLAIHTADEAGEENGPDYAFGWGLLNAEKAANMITNEGFQSYIRENSLAQGQNFSFNIEAFDPSKPLVATICWTDPAGQVISGAVDLATPSLVNDLDIRITNGSETSFPWKLNPAEVDAPATRGDNIVDNVEKIEIPNPSGKYTITVSHKGTLANGNQNYSLLISNVASNPIMLSSTTPLTNRICQGTAQSSFDFQLMAAPNFNETATFSVSGLPVGAVANFTPATMTASGNASINLTNLSGIAPGTYPLMVTAQSATATSELSLRLIVQNQLANGPQLLSPVNNANSSDINPVLSWQDMGDNVMSYTIDLSKNADFASAVQTFTSTSDNFNLTALDYGTTYFWRVKANNVCGSSVYSAVHSFTTTCSSALVVTISERTYHSLKATWTNPNAANSFEVYIVRRGTTPTTPAITVNTNTYTFDGLDSYTDYDVFVRSSCSLNTWSSWVSTPTQTLLNHCVDGVFFDSGGVSQNYSNGEYITTVMTPMNPGEKVNVTFTEFDLEDQADRLYIYNGPNNTFPFIGPDEYGFTGTNNPGTVTSTDASGTLTFIFYSDGLNTAPGWNATVSCAALATAGFNAPVFSYYPNPASNVVHFSANETIKSIAVYNMLGQMIQSNSPNSKQPTIDISNLATGQYLFKVQTESAVKIVKIVKKQ